MKILKKALLVLISIVALFFLSLYIYLQTTNPKYEGEVSLQNCNSTTTVYSDDFGVPHIYANSQKDAMTVLGYVHAQDRLWQMELMRRIAPGRLSELFGTKALKNDLISEVKKMNQINMNTIGKNAYTVSEFEFYKDAIEKDDNMSDKERKIREITYGGLIKIDELISLDDPKAYKKYINLK